MADILTERVCAEPDGTIVVFLIGMRINRPWKFWRWLPVLRAMPTMLQELAARPELGLLASRPIFSFRGPAILQYWRSAEHLIAYAHAIDRAHLPAWQAFNRAIGTSGDVGIWHETYVIPAGASEAIYVNMPRFGLGQIAEIYPARGDRATAGKRLARRP